MATKVKSLNIQPDLKQALADVASDLANVRPAALVTDVTAIRTQVVALVADVTAVRAPLAGLLTGSATYDAPSLIDAAGATTTVTVTGAALGDFAMASLGVDVAGISVTAYVSAADTVSVRLQNESGGTLDLASTTLRAVVLPFGSFVAPAAITAVNPAAQSSTAPAALNTTA